MASTNKVKKSKSKSKSKSKELNIKLSFRPSFPFISLSLSNRPTLSLPDRTSLAKPFNVIIYDQHYNLLGRKVWSLTDSAYRRLSSHGRVNISLQGVTHDLLVTSFDRWELIEGKMNLTLLVYNPLADARPAEERLKSFNSWEDFYGKETRIVGADSQDETAFSRLKFNG